jgi:hypothetical protein
MCGSEKHSVEDGERQATREVLLQLQLRDTAHLYPEHTPREQSGGWSDHVTKLCFPCRLQSCIWDSITGLHVLELLRSQ